MPEIQISVTVSPHKPAQPVGIRAYIYRNHEKLFYPFKPNQPNIPDSRPMIGAHVKNNGGTIYTKRLQYFLYNNLAARVPEMSVNRFDKEFIYWFDDDLAFFNFAGSDYRRLYPVNHNMSSTQDPHGQQILFGGWTLNLLSDKPEMIHGRLRYPFPCMDAFDPNIEDYNSFDHPDLWIRPAITAGPTKVFSEPFWMFYARGRHPLMLNGTKIAWVEADLVRILAPDEPTPPQFTKDWGS